MFEPDRREFLHDLPRVFSNLLDEHVRVQFSPLDLLQVLFPPGGHFRIGDQLVPDSLIHLQPFRGGQQAASLSFDIPARDEQFDDTGPCGGGTESAPFHFRQQRGFRKERLGRGFPASDGYVRYRQHLVLLPGGEHGVFLFPGLAINAFPSGVHRPAVSALEQGSPAFDADVRLLPRAVIREGFQHPACDHPVEVLLIKRQFVGYVFRYDNGMVSGHLAVIGYTGG